MSKVARAKKMFDDVSSDEDSKESDAAGLSPVVPAQSVDPHITGAETVPANKAESIITSEYAEGDSHAFVPKSVSASPATRKKTLLLLLLLLLLPARREKGSWLG